MKTLITQDPHEAASFVKNGGVVAFPTETVYGLGANVFDEEAIRKVFQAKGRPSDNPLIAHVATFEQIGILAAEITPSAKALIDRFFPGPLTVVLERTPAVPLIATAGLDTVGIRMPRNAIARSLIKAAGTPLVAPSANLSGRPSPTTWEAVLEDLDGRIDCILKGEPTEIGLESTVVDCTGPDPILLRQGAVTYEELREIVPSIQMADELAISEVRSPGLKHRHYSPNARVLIIDPTDLAQPERHSAFIGISSPTATFELTKVCGDLNEYAHTLFEFFRECDRKGIETIYCERVPTEGIGAAIMDRLERATRG
ncbi:MAG: threonylcarbamoyl-AMP synthase [Acidobacteria bacterium]|nr:threonylcarbamoyl-AMP synthase [Acidobacteriota bacterium]